MISVPQAVWMALISALAALLGVFLGVLLTNKHSRQQQANQLQHEAEKAAQERSLQLRREVYVPAAEAIAGLAAMLGRIVHLGTPEQDLTAEIGRYIGPLARIQLVAGGEAVAAVSALQREMSATILSLLSSRAPLVLRQSDIDAARRAIQKFSTDMDAANASMREIDAADRFDQHRWDAAELQLEFARTQHTKYLNEWTSLTKVQNREQLGYVGTAVRGVTQLSSLIAKAMAALRTELNLPDGADVLAKELHQTTQRMQQVMDESLVTLRNNVDEKERESADATV